MIIIWDIPYVKDLVKEETTEVVAIYIRYENGTTRSNVTRLYFEEEGYEFKLEVPKGNKYNLKLQIGQTYKIEYFSNSKVIKEYELINNN